MLQSPVHAQKVTGKTYQYTPYEAFKELVNTSPVFQALNAYGSSICPLFMAGIYLNYAGNHLLAHIYQTYNKAKVLHRGHKVVGISLLANGEILVTAIRKQTIV